MSGVSLAGPHSLYTALRWARVQGSPRGWAGPPSGPSGSEAGNSMLGGGHVSPGDGTSSSGRSPGGTQRLGETRRVRVLRVNKTVRSLDCRTTTTPRSTLRFAGSSAPGGVGCWSRAAKGQKAGRWPEGATWVQVSAAGRPARPRPHRQPRPPSPPPLPGPAEPPTWSGSLAVAPGKGSAERSSCPRRRPQCVGHGPRPARPPRRPHTLCAKPTDCGRPESSSSTRASAITGPGSPSAWRPLVAERRPVGPRGRKPERSREVLGITFGEDPWV